MSPDVPAGAAILLDFLAAVESGGRYDVIYDHHERDLSSPITSMTIDQLLSAQIGWGRKWRSSAAGRYQIVQTTLAGLVRQGVVKGSDVFSPDVQDELGYALLKRRGYADFKAKRLPLTSFAAEIAMEWASMPVLVARRGAHGEIEAGQSYYANDGLNKELVTAAAFREALERALAASA